MSPKNYSKINAAICISESLSIDSAFTYIVDTFLGKLSTIPVNIEMALFWIKEQFDLSIFIYKSNVMEVLTTLLNLHQDLSDFKILNNLND